MSARAKYELIRRLESLGFTYDEAQQLRRIQLTLHRWAEQECGDGNDYCSWSIERDEETGKPFRCVYPHNGQMRKHVIADREAGALRRLRQILAQREQRRTAIGAIGEAIMPRLSFYQQTDPRGCALYILRQDDIAGPLESCYTRGIAVCD